MILHAGRAFASKQTHESDPLFVISEDLSIWTCYAEIYAGNWDAMNAKQIFFVFQIPEIT